MLEKIREAYIENIKLKYNNRSSKPANIMHDAIREELLKIVSTENYSIRTNNHGKEFKFSSEIHEKKIDITIVDKDTNAPIIAVSFKFPLMSVNKNLKNYFEMNIGDSTLVRQNGTPFYFFMILDNNSLKVDDGFLKNDLISNKSIESFSKVMVSNYYSPYRPNQMFILKVDFGDRSYKDLYIGERRSKLVDDRLKHIEEIEHKELSASVYTSDGQWEDCWEPSLELFFESIKLEVELYKIRKKLQK